MKRQIAAFEMDEYSDWRAALECGHFQHMRHNPPLTTRCWVLTEAGRASRIGFELDCKRCYEEAERESSFG
jgi:hypothetical protein